MELDIENLTREWHRKFPKSDFRAESFKTSYEDRWVRFYVLPGAKRYPENENEYELLLERHSTLLDELNTNGRLLVVTCEWTDSLSFGVPEQWANSDMQHWQTIHESQDGKLSSYRQLYVSSVTRESGKIDKLLRGVADNEIAGVIIMPEDLSWLYHPYDGGVDIILPSSKERDDFRLKHQAWTT